MAKKRKQHPWHAAPPPPHLSFTALFSSQLLRKEALVCVRGLDEATQALEAAKARAPKLPRSLDLDALFGGDILTSQMLEDTTEIGIGTSPYVV
jgi:hypothetical protein